MRQTTICRQFVYFLSTFCLGFVQDLSQQRQKKLSFVKIFRKKFWICLIFVLKNLYKFCLCCFSNFSRQKSDKSKTFSGKSWQMTIFFCLCCDKSWTKTRQNQDKNKTKSRQNVDKLSTNCRLSHSLAKPSVQVFVLFSCCFCSKFNKGQIFYCFFCWWQISDKNKTNLRQIVGS